MQKVINDKIQNLNIISNNIRNVEAFNVKCDNKNELCNKYNIYGYPFIKYNISGYPFIKPYIIFINTDIIIVK